MKHEATKLATTLDPIAAFEVHVSDVEELYAAVNNDANIGATIVLRSNTYILTRTVETRRDGIQDRPHGGRLELKRDMSLRGDGDPSKCVLETSPTDLPIFNVISGARSGMIRAGLGTHTIEGLTIVAPDQAGSGISTDLEDPQSLKTEIRIVGVFSGDPTANHQTRGIDIRNTGTAIPGRSLSAVIEGCEFYGGTQGIRIANFQGAHGCQVHVKMSGNRSYHNFAGCLIANHRSDDGFIEVSSVNDQFTENGVGCAVIGGIISGTRNQTFFSARQLVSENNRGPVDSMTGHAGGVVARGADTGQPNLASENSLVVELADCQVNSNQAPGDVIAHGAFSKDVAGVAGKNNTVRILLLGNNNFIPDATDSRPAETPPKTNFAIVT